LEYSRHARYNDGDWQVPSAYRTYTPKMHVTP